MSTDDGDLTIVFNGEIYNYVELKVELTSLGHRFRSTSDTEVLLTAYRQWGVDCVQRFNGMWAFLIHDRKANSVFGSRDRMGVKPLYLWQNDDWFVLASEPRAIGATGLTTLEPDWERFAESLVWNLMDHENGTCFAGIRQVPAGSRFLIAGGQISCERFWTLPEGGSSEATQPDDQWVGTLRSLVSDAVRLRQRSDVPIGFTLSGGIDSTMLICEAARLDEGEAGLVAFAYQDDAYDEKRQVHDTVVQTGAKLISINERDLDLCTTLPALIQANGEPVHSMSAVANYALFELASKYGVKVVIGGQGSDEAFAGYLNFEESLWLSLVRDFQISALISDIVASSRISGRSATAVVLGTLIRAIRITLADTRPYGWARDRLARQVPQTLISELFAADLLTRAGPLKQRKDAYFLETAQRRSLQEWPLPMYLRIEDRCSMAHSVEARLPFTDYRLVELAMRMPRLLKFARGMNKVALRRAATGRVPASVTSNASKLGFPVSISTKGLSDLRTLGSDLIGSRAFAERGIYNVRNARKLVAVSPEETTPAQADAMFRLTQTELWLRIATRT
jgi:asparagine synthase (glutamine-hydrolysing)